MNVTDRADRIIGSLIGGAAGDALGYAVEFMNERSIFHTYSAEGIRSYRTQGGRAIISDDTQMTLFTACGLLNAVTDARMNGAQPRVLAALADAYLDWYQTQRLSYKTGKDQLQSTWLRNVPELFVPRAPGNTCLSALSAMSRRDPADRSRPAANNSKGCGGVMRVAPMALFDGSADPAAIAKLAAESVALTHGHPLAQMPAAVMTSVIHRCVFPRRELSFREIVIEAVEEAKAIFSDNPYIDDLDRLLNAALTLSRNSSSDLDNIHRLGEGWVGDEALAIALYCCLKSTDDFDACITVAVNHKGDSDSTGAVAGNLLGAWLGMDAIGANWTEELELTNVIDELAHDLYDVNDTAGDPTRTEQWMKK
ncbi:MAG: ADP-ribosylglycohydrolase family protein, partial [Lachnospiraceae bacterium]|nr:ADP-ribosylglycohydrolase family protein [Lachnospiraceae bacterium]